MQSRYRSSGDGYRPYRNPNPNPNRGRRPYQKPYHHPPPPPPAAAAVAASPRRGDVFMEAGRLAAEYFVSKGLLPPASLHRPAGQRREVAAAPEPRTSALARLGNPRGFDDEYTSQRGRKRNAPYARDYTNSEHDARRGQWRGYTDAIDGDDGGFAYQRRRFDEGGSSVRTAVSDDRHSKSEATGESGTVVDEMIEDTTSTRKDRLAEGLADGSNGAKVSSSEEVRSDVSGDSKKCDDGVTYEAPCVQGDESGAQPDSKSEVGNALGVTSGAEIIEEEPIKESNGKDLTGTMECQDSAISSGPPNDRMEEGVELEHEAEECPPGFEASKMPLDAIEEGDIVHDEPEECPPGFEASKMPLDAIEEGDMAQDELEECPPGFEASKMTLDETKEGDVAQNVDKMEGVNTRTECQEGEYSLQALEMKQSSPCVDGLSGDDMLERVDEKKPVGEEANLLPKFEPEIDVKMEEEKQLLASSFDLNLIGTPETTEIPEMTVIPEMTAIPEITEITEIPVDAVDHLQTSSPIAIPDDPVDHLQISSPITIPDDPVDHLQTSSPIAITDDHIDHLQTSSPIVITDDHIDHLQTSSPITVADDCMGHLQTSRPSAEKGKEVAVNGDLSIGNNTDVTDDYAQLSVISKEIPVINLEVDSPIDDGGCDPSKLDNERMYSNMDNFPSETAQDLGIHDGYSLAFSDFLGNDMSGCSSVPGDLNNMQGGIGLHDAQGVTGDDDPIYVSLDEIPIGFMGLWDQPPSEYGKFY